MNAPDPTFLFTDIEGSTPLWREAPEAMPALLARHDEALGQVIAAAGGRVFKHTGDGYAAAFADPCGAVRAAVSIQQHELSLEGNRVWVRVAVHQGPALERDGDFFGLALSRTARLLGAGHGGQVLLSGGTAEVVQAGLPEGCSLQELGLFRLRDLTTRERIFQVHGPGLRETFPPLRTLEAFLHNLPAQLTTFIGREAEMDTLRDLMRRHRVVTLTGTGGAGKSRLALQLGADALEAFEHGVRLVELASVPEPGLLAGAVAAVLGLKNENRPVVETLVDHLRDRQMLLVIDNCEHLIDAAAATVSAILTTCPEVRVLATSREPLNVPGEAAFRVPSLSLPEPGSRGGQSPALTELARFEALRLFEDRARLLDPTFTLTEETAPAALRICRRLDGMPLAIELAAARVKVLSVTQIADRLDDRFRLLRGNTRGVLPRQQTLRALVDWSHELLSAEEQALLRRLAVFAGGWDLEAAEEVCEGNGVDADDVLDLLQRLVEKSLVTADTAGESARFRLLETIREYGRERLALANEEHDYRDRHLQWMLDLAVRGDDGLAGPDQQIWLDQLEQEHDNCRAALSWSELRGQAPAMQRLGGAIWRFWYLHGHYHEGREWLTRSLALSEHRTAERAGALNGAGVLAWVQGDRVASRLAHEEALAIRRVVGPITDVAGSLNNLGLLSRLSGDLPAAQGYLEEAAQILRQALHRARLATVLNNLGGIASECQENDRAERLYREALPFQMTPAGRSDTLSSLGSLLAPLGRAGEALPLLREALEIRVSLGDLRSICRSLAAIASALACIEQEETATVLLGATTNLRRQVEAFEGASEAGFERTRASAEAALDPGLFQTLWKQGEDLTLTEAVRLALEASEVTTPPRSERRNTTGGETSQSR